MVQAVNGLTDEEMFGQSQEPKGLSDDELFGDKTSPSVHHMGPSIPPFPIDHFIDFNSKKLSPEGKVEYRSNFANFLHKTSDHLLNTGLATASAIDRGVAGFIDHFDSVLNYANNQTVKNISMFGAPEGYDTGKGGVSEEKPSLPIQPNKLVKTFNDKADHWQKEAEQNGIHFLDNLIGETMGGAPTGVAQFMLDVASGYTLPLMSGAEKGQEKNENPMIDGLIEAGKTKIFADIFKMIDPYSRWVKAAVMGPMMSADAAIHAPEGHKIEAAENGIGSGLLLASITSPGGVKMNDIYPEIKKPEVRQEIAQNPQPPQEIKPAVKEGKEIKTGGKNHEDIEPNAPEENRGFVTPDGKFLNRQEAVDWLKENRPDVYANLDDAAKEGLHSEELNKAMSLGAAAYGFTPDEPSTTGTFKPAVSPLGIWGKVGQIFKDMHDAVTISVLPKLSEYGLRTSAIQHAYARVAVPKIVNDMISRVFPDEYKNPDVGSKTMDILVKDNILGGYDSFVQRYAEALQAGDDVAAKKWQKAIKDIQDIHNLGAMDRDVQAAQKNEKISGNINRWKQHVVPALDKLYNEQKNVDPNTEREGRGRYFDSRINLLTKDKAQAWQTAMTDGDTAMPEPSASSYRNPNVKRDPNDMMAYFTGDYSTDTKAILSSVFGNRWNEVTKIRFYNEMMDKGMATEAEQGQEAPEGQKRLPIRMPETNSNGKTQMVEKSLFVPSEAVEEIRRVLGTDMKLKMNKVGGFLTQVQLTQIADLVTHTKNIMSVISRAQGAGSTWTDIGRKVPFFNTADATYRILKTTREVLSDTPEIRKEIADMAQQGFIRPEFPLTGIQKITRGQQIIHEADTASRVIMNRFFNELVKENKALDTPENRYDFVSQIGEYNKRLMNHIQSKAAESGLSPFIVAGRNFNRQGRWAISGNPGLKAASTNAAVQMRVTNLLGTAMLFTMPMFLNYLTTGQMTGREGTPLGAWDLGMEPDDETGKHKAIDLMQLSGARRGMRSIGLDAAINGLMNGDNANEIIGNAIQDAGNTMIHPWMGPALGFVSKTATGRQLDMRGYMEAERVPEGGGLQYLENFRAALESQNPLVYSLVRPAFEEVGLDQKLHEGYGKEVGKTFLKSPAGAFGVKDVKPPPSEAERMKKEITVQKKRLKKDIEKEEGLEIKKLKKKFYGG